MADVEFSVSGLDDFVLDLFRKCEEKYPRESQEMVKECVKRCKQTAAANTPVRKKGKSSKTKSKWRQKVKRSDKKTLGIVYLKSGKGHLIENGHIDSDTGRFVPGAHMLEKTMAQEQPRIDRDIEKLVERVFDL